MLHPSGGRSSGCLYCRLAGSRVSASGGWTCGHSTQPLCGDMASVGDEVMSAYCQLTTQYTARRGSAESSVDDFDTCRGDVFIRAVPILRYIESQPSTGRFVSMQYTLAAYLTHFQNTFFRLPYWRYLFTVWCVSLGL